MMFFFVEIIGFYYAKEKNHKVGHFHFMIFFAKFISFYYAKEKNHKVAMRSKEQYNYCSLERIATL